VLRPGDYAFSIKTTGPGALLTLRGLHGTGTDAMLFVADVESTDSNQSGKLVLVSRKGQSFVSAMQLPAYEMTLNFAVPPEKSSK
jgi:hypothetical protein